MSLESNGQEINLKGIASIHALNLNLKDKEVIRCFSEYNSDEASKELFMKAIDEFTKTEEFKKFIYELNSGLVISVNRNVILSMPR